MVLVLFDGFNLYSGVVKVSNMAEENRAPRKMTTKELTEAVHGLGSSMNRLANALTEDMTQIMAVLGGLLTHLGLLETITCPSCGTELRHPKLDEVPAPTHCPACGSDLDTKEEE